MFYVLKGNRVYSPKSPFKLEKELVANAGKLKLMKKARKSGGLVEIISISQENTLSEVKVFNGVPEGISPHIHLYHCKSI